MGVTTLKTAIWLVHALAVVLAWLVVRRAREHVWAAAIVTWMLADDLVREVVYAATRPFPGLAHLARSLDHVLVLGWTFPYLAVCAIYFLRRRDVAIAAMIAWALMSGVMIATAPTLGRTAIDTVYRVLYWFGVASTWLMILLGVFGDRALKPRLAHLVIILYAATDVVGACFPWLEPVLGRRWTDVNWLNLFNMSACSIAHLVVLARPKLAEEAAA
jgi:hypothetical protein